MVVQSHGSQLEGYELVEEIGSGDFSTVFRAYQAGIGREVALKVIRPQVAGEPEFIRRFEGEAQAVARLQHPFIVPLYDYWRDPQGAYLVMRWLRGGSLRASLGTGPIPLKEAAAMLDQLAAALSAAHRAQVIHCDLKPANLLLDEDRNAYVSDFAIARKLAMAARPLNSPGAIVGSTGYLSPEQARGEPLTPQTDIYSLGVTMYEILTGQHPFHDLSSVERLYGHINDPLPRLSGLPLGADEAVNDVIQKATAKNPANRYQNVMDFARAFRSAVSDHERKGELLAEQLTPREMDILELLGQGLSNQEIADRLVISLATVKWYNQQIYGKLDVSNRVQAAIRARKANLFGRQAGSAEAARTGADFSYLPEPRNPYKGLNAFQVADSDDFFGREASVKHVLEAMAEVGEKRFLALVGPSGSGKTSLLRAGLLPAINDGRLPGSNAWFTAIMLPGAHALDSLEIALSNVAVRNPGNVGEQLRRDARGLLRAAELILPSDDSLLLLAIDQFEELFTLVEDEAERRHLLELIYAAATDPRSRVHVVVTLRADYYDRPLRYPQFGELLRSRMQTILPLSAKDLQRAVAAPAEGVHVTFEEGLVARIVSEVAYQPGALPLLQVALRELFERREGHLITNEAYEDIGCAVGALANRAERAYQELDSQSQDLIRQLFLRLAVLDEETPGWRLPSYAGRRVPRDELLSLARDPDLMDEIVDLLASYRLLTLDHDPGSRRPTVTLAHESLLREWNRLGDWVEDARGEMRLHRQLARMEDEWRRAGYDISFLLRGSRLDQFAGWSANTTLRLTRNEQSYLEASLAARRKQQEVIKARRQRELETARQLAEMERRRAREQEVSAGRLRRRAMYLAGAVVLSLLLALAAGLSAREASRQRAIASEQLALTRSRELALGSLSNLERDPELSILLALAALSETHTIEAEQMLHRALMADRLMMRLQDDAVAAFRVAYSPDGTQLATMGIHQDGTGSVTVWNAATGKQQFTLHGMQPYEAIAFNPDGTLLATSAAATEPSTAPPIQLWDSASGREVATLDLGGRESHPTCDQNEDFHINPGFYSIDFSPDGRRLATYHCLEGRSAVTIWDLESGGQLLALPDFQTMWSWNPVVVFSPGGEYLAANSATPDGASTVTVWDAGSGQMLHILEHGQSRAVADVSFSPDGQLLATAGLDGLVRLWDVVSGEQVEAIDSGSPEVWGVAFDGDGTRLATALPDGRTRVWEIETGRSLLDLSSTTERYYAVAFRPNGEQLATVDLSGAALIWNLSPVAEFFAAGGETDFERVAYLANHRSILTSDTIGGLTVWDVESGRRLHSWQAHERGAVNFAISANGSSVATAAEDGQVILWEVPSGAQLWAEDEQTALWGIDISPDGTRLAVAGLAENSISVRDLREGALIEALIINEAISTLGYDPRGERLAVGTLGAVPKVVVILDAHTGEQLLALEDDKFGDGTNSLAFAPNGQKLAAGSFNGRVTIFDSHSGAALLTFAAHDGPIWDLAFTRDGTQLATASVDGTVKLWDAADGELRLNLQDFGGAVAGIDFNLDGSRLVAASYDRAVRGFVLDLEELMSLARSRLTRSFTADECRQYLHLDTCPEFAPGSVLLEANPQS